jgi:hypothetical protein
VCISRLHSYALDYVRGPAREALSVLAAKLPPSPNRVLVQSVDDRAPDDPHPSDILVARISFFDDVTEYTSDDLLWIMLNGAGVPPCANIARPNPQDEPENKGDADTRESEYLAARLVAAAWLLDRDLAPAGTNDKGLTLASDALTTLRGLPADEQQARVTALRDAERTCAQGDRLEMLTGQSADR